MRVTGTAEGLPGFEGRNLRQEEGQDGPRPRPVAKPSVGT